MTPSINSPYMSLPPRWQLRNTPLFHSTNEKWNGLRLNLSWVIGSLSLLFRDSQAQSFSDWESHYLQSGELRKKKLACLPKEKRQLLEDFTIPLTNPAVYNQLSQKERELNTQYGRTRDDLRKIGDYFYHHLRQYPQFKTLSRSMCQNYVLIRVIDETFIGFQREINAIRNLQSKFPSLTFKSVSSKTDTRYAIDVEVFKDNQRLLALQIKSPRYANAKNTTIIPDVKELNHRKNQNYVKKFQVPVLYVYAKMNGFIVNYEIFQLLRLYV